jgi:glycosyltransferase involved in cell wall biosynthesis
MIINDLEKMKNMKKICIDARMLKNAGIGSYLRTILHHLNHEPYDISLIVNKKYLKKEKEFKNFNLIYLNAPIYSLKEQILFSFKIPKCDLFFSPHFNVPIFPIRAKKRVVTIHDVYHLAFLFKLSFIEKIYAKFIINKAVKLSDKIITVSNFSKEEIVKYTNVKKEKIKVIHNAIDLNIFKKCLDSSVIKSVKKKLNLPEKYFLFVGNLKPHKNLINILRAFEIFQREYEDYQLVIVGSDKNLIHAVDVKKLLANKKDFANKINLTGYASIEDLPIIYQSAKALVFPSLYEGFGYPPIEAMSLDCPVIVSNLASLPEICLDAAFYVDPYDIKNISFAMKEIIENEKLRSSLIEKGRKRVKFFTIENFIKSHIEQFEFFL